MKIGDMVIRKIPLDPKPWKQGLWHEDVGPGIILSKQMSGDPLHSCITVYYPKVGKIYDIAESLMEVISESR